MRPWTFSPSQIQLWNTCPSKWGFKYIEKLPGTNKYAQRGSDLHAMQEAWLLHGVVPDDSPIGRLAAAGGVHLPLPGTAQIEGRFKFQSRLGVSWTGAIDCLYWDEEKELITILDHKTTSDLKWALTPETLRSNEQSVVYGTHIGLKYSVDRVQLKWVYYEAKKDRPKVRPVVIQAQVGELQDELDKLDAICGEISTIGLSASKAAELPRNADACDAYGGCPYRKVCPITDMERLGAVMTQQSIRDRILNQAQGAAAPSLPANSILARMQAATGAAPTPTPTPTPTPPPAAIAAVGAPAPAAATAPAAAPSLPANSILARMQAAKAHVAAVPSPTPAAAIEAPTAPSLPANSILARMQAAKAHVAAVPPPAATAPTQAPLFVDAPAAATAGASVLPPEAPTTLIDDPEELKALVEQAKAAQIGATQAELQDQLQKVSVMPEVKKRGRAANSAKVALGESGITDVGLIYAMVFSDVCRESRGDIQLALKCASFAIAEYKKI